MIFVTVGNATQRFRRLLDAVEELKEQGLFNEEPVLIQTGNNPEFHPRYCECKPFLGMDEFQQQLEKADVIVSHGGCGTLLQCVRLGKVPVVMPRRKKYGEHVNDHQVQLAEALAAERRVVPAYEPEDLPGAIAEARRRAHQPCPPPRSRMLELVSQAIEELLARKG